MTSPLFIATERFDPSDGEKWQRYCDWAGIHDLVEVVSLDAILCQPLISELHEEDWRHNVKEDHCLNYFHDLDYLTRRTRDIPRKNVLGLYRNPERHIAVPPGPGDFTFVGYDLIEEQTQISALTNCGGFPDVFRNDELNRFGLLDRFDRACDVRRLLAQSHPDEAHAQCELYALWRLQETSPK